ncbi:MAG: hypothetical protein O2894_08715 [Planctomycetota bacterium]|nr:hypothetical protein [Planctomycetota bacterium]
MPSPESLRRLANLTKKVRDDLRTGGMGVNFRYLFRSTAILARVVEILADHVATQAEEQQAEEALAAAEQGTLGESTAASRTAAERVRPGRERAEERA